MGNKSKKGLIIFISVIAIVILTVTGASIYNYMNPNPVARNYNVNVTTSFGNNRIRISTSRKQNSVAVIHVEGTIDTANSTYNQEWIMATIESAMKNPRNVALVLSINSPGGAVYETDEVYHALQKYKTTGRPVYAYFNQLAASGGYYMACAADKIYANRNTLTGSIGVISGQFIDLTQLFEDYGINYVTVHAGKNKNMGNYNEKITQEQIDIMQSVADECYEQFTLIVANGRGMSQEDVIKLADGRIYTAKQALLNGLIDRISTFDNMMRDLEDKLDVDINVEHYAYERKMTFMESMMGFATNMGKSKAATDIPGRLLAEAEEFTNYPAYLYK